MDISGEPDTGKSLLAHYFTSVRVGHSVSGLVHMALSLSEKHTSQLVAWGRVSASDWRCFSRDSFCDEPFRMNGARIYILPRLASVDPPDPIGAKHGGVDRFTSDFRSNGVFAFFPATTPQGRSPQSRITHPQHERISPTMRRATHGGFAPRTSRVAFFFFFPHSE